ncbi:MULTISPECIES: GntR family transcriptional regulator [unclassified Mycoplasma]|uniref:winged helix-turn-helix domain-containing protein n=1 Tax=unclassified Mycoplasma TaxID=2683645 RepID=UPI00211BE7B8|nr:MULTISPECIES: GntR family transcriptional regulator [unclassified Mycoplasma]UUM19916.1 GntR family transcriptional regulator [Mycoplasma sp. 1578d]UUM24896.1 GntR family transcriptional regulator [Mycoplasma sp. 3686d]
MKYAKNDISKTQEIIDYLLELIKSKKIPVNKVMPSEHALMNRFECSRGVVVSAYNKLAALGAVYSINKRGHFVAENFHNLIKPLSYMLKCDQQIGVEITSKAESPKWFETKNIIFLNGYRVFEKEYFKDGIKIAEGITYVSSDLFKIVPEINLNESITDILLNNKMLNNIIYFLEYQNVNKFGFEKLVAINFYGYDTESISIAGTLYVHPDHFQFFHQEFGAVNKIS